MPVVDVVLGKGVRLAHPELVNLYGCVIGDESFIGPFVEIQAGVQVGKRCKIQSHSFISEGVSIGNGVFIGHGVMFTNDRHPRAVRPDGELVSRNDWTLERTVIEDGASIGSGAVILPGLTIGTHAMIGAGSVVTKNLEAFGIYAGNPARLLRHEV